MCWPSVRVIVTILSQSWRRDATRCAVSQGPPCIPRWSPRRTCTLPTQARASHGRVATLLLRSGAGPVPLWSVSLGPLCAEYAQGFVRDARAKLADTGANVQLDRVRSEATRAE